MRLIGTAGMVNSPMVSRAELSSMSTAISELAARVTTAADEMVGGPLESVAVDLFEVERSLRTARRRLDAAAVDLPD